MTNLPAILKFEDYEVRLIEIDGEPWWVLADVCAALAIVNSRDAAARLDEDEKGTVAIDDGQGGPDRTIISEPGLYKLIQTSRKPVAKRFDRWNRHQVLPSIRKTGSYGSQVPAVAEQIIAGLKEALAPLAIRFDGQDRAIERIERRTDTLVEDMAWVKIQLHNRRRKLSDETKAEHIDAAKKLGGTCPCCRLATIIEDGKRSVFSEFDHFYQNSHPDADHTWLICKPCHSELTQGRVPRDQREAEFRSYQNQRRRLPGRQIALVF